PRTSDGGGRHGRPGPCRGRRPRRRGGGRGAVTARSALAAALAATCVGLAACGGGEDPPDARDFAGAWDVQLFVGDVQAHPDAVVTVARGDTFRERWVFEDCDESRCTLRRPDGGLALGDLTG